jgi:O-antigen/teichoic acid export membrane protein
MNLLASYGQLGVNVLYSLVSIPLILKYLPKEEFGLWATLMQLVGYFALVDFGMTSAAARLLVDHKDDRSIGNYGSLIKTTGLVSLIQGIVVFLLCLGSAPLMAGFIKVPLAQMPLFQNLFILQGAIAASGFIFRPFGIILYAHQKEYIPILVATIALLLSLVLLWIMLAHGKGIYSFIYTGLLIATITPVALFLNCRKLGYLPSGLEWGRITKQHFYQVFGYGKDIFLMNMGAQLITTSQLIIISRCLGLESAAVWAIGTKMFNLIIPLMCRPLGAAIPGMSEMLVREEIEQLYKRFREMVVLTCSLGVYLGISYALCNSLFVILWTHGRISWSPLKDLLLGAWVILSSMQTTHGNFVSVTKQIGGMRYIYFGEGVCFVVMGLLVSPHYGIIGIIASSITSTLLFSYQYSLRRSRDYFHDSLWEIAVVWIAPSLKFAFIYIPIAFITWFGTYKFSLTVRLEINAIVAIFLGTWLFLKIGLTPKIIQEIENHSPKSLKIYLKIVSCI